MCLDRQSAWRKVEMFSINAPWIEYARRALESFKEMLDLAFGTAG